MTNYTAYSLSAMDVVTVRDKFEQKFSKAYYDHITYCLGKPENMNDFMLGTSFKVVGYACNDRIEALVVEVNGSTVRPDGKTFHITLSYDDSVASPKDSNILLQNGWEPVEHFELQPYPVIRSEES